MTISGHRYFRDLHSEVLIISVTVYRSCGLAVLTGLGVVSAKHRL